MLVKLDGGGNTQTEVEFLSHFENVRQTGPNQWEARCRCHDDQRNSLSIGKGDDDRRLIHCHAGCDTEDILKVVGLTMDDLFPCNGRSNDNDSVRSRIVATYDYRDESGVLRHQSVRYQPKGFKQRRPDGKGGWIWTLKDIGRVLYRLPELLSADPSETVFIVEGEKDVDRLRSLGLVATCNAEGAGKWRPEFAKYLKNRNVVVLPDNDKPGSDHAESIGRSADGKAVSVKVVELPGLSPKGDVSDWLDAGGTVSELQQLVAEADEWEPTADDSADGDELLAPIKPVSFGELMERYPELRKPVIHGIAREGEVCNIIAPSKVGKSWLVYMLTSAIVLGRRWLERFQCERGRVLLIDNELHQETIHHRILTVANAMGIEPNDYKDCLDVISLRGRLTNYPGLRHTIDQIEAGYYQAIIVDAHYRMLPDGTDENSNAAMAQVYNLIDKYADQTGAAWFLIHHSSKGNQAGKDVTDVGSGAGSQSRAADSHLVLREHETEGHVVLDAAVRSWPPLQPITLEWSYPLWRPSDLNPGKLKGQRAQTNQKVKDQENAGKIINGLKDGPAIQSEICTHTGLSRDIAKRLLDKMTANEQLELKTGENDRQEYHLLNVGDACVGGL